MQGKSQITNMKLRVTRDLIPLFAVVGLGLGLAGYATIRSYVTSPEVTIIKKDQPPFLKKNDNEPRAS